MSEPAGPAPAVRRLRAAAAAAGVPLRQARLGESSETGGLRWVVLGPDRVVREGSPPNNASLVLSAETGGLRILLTGDVEPEAQRPLLRRLDADGDGDADAGAYDVLKVPHHGSANQLPALFAAVDARVAVVSVGAGNDYGHPAPSAVRLLESRGALVERTDRRGDVAVSGPSTALRVHARR